MTDLSQFTEELRSLDTGYSVTTLLDKSVVVETNPDKEQFFFNAQGILICNRTPNDLL